MHVQGEFLPLGQVDPHPYPWPRVDGLVVPGSELFSEGTEPKDRTTPLFAEQGPLRPNAEAGCGLHGGEGCAEGVTLSRHLESARGPQLATENSVVLQLSCLRRRLGSLECSRGALDVGRHKGDAPP